MANEIIILRDGLTFFDKSVILSWNRYHQNKNTMSDEIKTTVPVAAPKQFPVYFSKSNFHRVIHADGVFGGVTPTPGEMVIHFFSHRLPLPEQVVNDTTGKEILEKRIIKPGVEREVEVSCVMSLATAKSMYDWLKERIEYAEQFTQKK